MAVQREIKNSVGLKTKSGDSTVIVIDQNDEHKRRDEAHNIHTMNTVLRSEEGIDFKRCILAIHDPEASEIYNIPARNNRHLAMIEVVANEDENIKLKVTKLTGVLVKNHYTVLATKYMKNESFPSAKLIVNTVPKNVGQ